MYTGCIHDGSLGSMTRLSCGQFANRSNKTCIMYQAILKLSAITRSKQINRVAGEYRRNRFTSLEYTLTRFTCPARLLRELAWDQDGENTGEVKENKDPNLTYLL